jgi:hypothetical protein
MQIVDSLIHFMSPLNSFFSQIIVEGFRVWHPEYSLRLVSTITTTHRRRLLTEMRV